MVDKRMLIKAVYERLDLEITEAERLCERVELLHSDLDQVINNWIETAQIPDYSIHGVTIKDIMDKEKSNIIRALFSMSVLIKNPQFAKQYNQIKFDLED